MGSSKIVALLFLVASTFASDALISKPVTKIKLLSEIRIAPTRSTINQPKRLAVNSTQILVQPDKTNIGASGNAAPFTPVGIDFHGGSTLDQGVNVYLIWYGSWTTLSRNIVKAFVNSLGPSNAATSGSVRSWWNTNCMYYSKTGAYLKPNVVLKKEAFDSYSQGSYSLSGDQIARIVTDKLESGALPVDPNGAYMVIPSKDTSVSGFCSSWCGYHTGTYYSNVAIKFALVGNAVSQCPYSCDYASSPNGDPDGADGLLSIFAHELTEIATDPWGNGWWYSRTGDENADKCAYKYGTIKYDSGGNAYNLVGNYGYKFRIQQNWDPKSGKCVSGAGSTVPTPRPSPSPPPPSGGCRSSISTGNVGTFITLFSQEGYKGSQYRVESPTVNGCSALNEVKLKSMLIDWNVKDGSLSHTGCRKITLWTTLNCQGWGKSWTLSQPWNPKKFDYPKTEETNLTKLSSAEWNASQIHSVGCSQ